MLRFNFKKFNCLINKLKKKNNISQIIYKTEKINSHPLNKLLANKEFFKILITEKSNIILPCDIMIIAINVSLD